MQNVFSPGYSSIVRSYLTRFVLISRLTPCLLPFFHTVTSWHILPVLSASRLVEQEKFGY